MGVKFVSEQGRYVAGNMSGITSTWFFGSFNLWMFLCRTCDRLVDYMNAAGSKKGAPIINSANHPLMYAMLECLDWFADWKKGLEEHNEPDIYNISFLPKVIWEDLNILLLGTVACCRFYLTSYPERHICQRRLNQDAVEHHFAHIRGGGGDSRNPTAFGACCATTNGGEVRGVTGGNGNCSGPLSININSALSYCDQRERQNKKLKLGK